MSQFCKYNYAIHAEYFPNIYFTCLKILWLYILRCRRYCLWKLMKASNSKRLQAKKPVFIIFYHIMYTNSIKTCLNRTSYRFLYNIYLAVTNNISLLLRKLELFRLQPYAFNNTGVRQGRKHGHSTGCIPFSDQAKKTWPFNVPHSILTPGWVLIVQYSLAAIAVWQHLDDGWVSHTLIYTFLVLVLGTEPINRKQEKTPEHLPCCCCCHFDPPLVGADINEGRYNLLLYTVVS